MKIKQILIAASAAAVVIASPAVLAAVGNSSSLAMGVKEVPYVPTAKGEQDIMIKPDTRSISADRGSEVRLINASTGQSAVVDFDTFKFKVADLQTIAPDVVDHRVVAYIADPNDGD